MNRQANHGLHLPPRWEDSEEIVTVVMESGLYYLELLEEIMALNLKNIYSNSQSDFPSPELLNM